MNKGQRVSITSVHHNYKDYGKRGTYVGLHSPHKAIIELDSGERWIGNKFDFKKCLREKRETVAQATGAGGRE